MFIEDFCSSYFMTVPKITLVVTYGGKSTGFYVTVA